MTLRSVLWQLKKETYKTFILFLFLSFFFWVLSKFSKEYTESLEAQIRFTDLPENIAIIGDNPIDINFDMKSNGFDFLYRKLKKPIVELNINPYYKPTENQIVITGPELVKILYNEFSNNAVVHVPVNGLIIQTEKVTNGRFPVKVRTDLSFKEGFKVVGILSIPDSVQVTAPKSILDTLDGIETEVLTEINADHTINKVLNLIKTGGSLKIEPKKVDVQVNIKEFTQKEILVPLVLINGPESKKVKLIPETVPIIFTISVEEFNAVSESDFRVVCDFDSRNDIDNTITVEIDSAPVTATEIKLGLEKVEYLFFK